MSASVWTEDLVTRLYEMRAAGMQAKDIAIRLRLSRRTIENRLYWDRLTPEQLAERRERINSLRRVATKEKRVAVEMNTASNRPTPEMLAERDRRRAMPHRDLTAFLMGDPRLGCSALDGMYA